LDATVVGANATIEIFELNRGELELVHVKTIASDAVLTPNGVAATGNGGVVVTNDHNAKIGLVCLPFLPGYQTFC
jgi:hypothetical protein